MRDSCSSGGRVYYCHKGIDRRNIAETKFSTLTLVASVGVTAAAAGTAYAAGAAANVSAAADAANVSAAADAACGIAVKDAAAVPVYFILFLGLVSFDGFDNSIRDYESCPS